MRAPTFRSIEGQARRARPELPRLRAGPGFLWTLPVDRRRQVLSRALAGWVWLMAGIALFVLWLFAICLLSGGRVLPETLRLVTSEVNMAAPIDPAALRTVRWSPGPLIWAVPFTAATACYLLASALALGSRRPMRWVVGSLVAFLFASTTSRVAGQHLGVGWLADAPWSVLGPLVEGRYGLDAVLTARLESLGSRTTLATGEATMIWWAVPDLADWGAATLLWTVVGLLAIWAAASRHGERRRA